MIITSVKRTHRLILNDSAPLSDSQYWRTAGTHVEYLLSISICSSTTAAADVPGTFKTICVVARQWTRFLLLLAARPFGLAAVNPRNLSSVDSALFFRGIRAHALSAEVVCARLCCVVSGRDKSRLISQFICACLCGHYEWMVGEDQLIFLEQLSSFASTWLQYYYYYHLLLHFLLSSRELILDNKKRRRRPLDNSCDKRGPAKVFLLLFKTENLRGNRKLCVSPNGTKKKNRNGVVLKTHLFCFAKD